MCFYGIFPPFFLEHMKTLSEERCVDKCVRKGKRGKRARDGTYGEKERKQCSYPLGWKWWWGPGSIMPLPLGRRGNPLKGGCPGGGGGSGGGGPCL